MILDRVLVDAANLFEISSVAGAIRTVQPYFESVTGLVKPSEEQRCAIALTLAGDVDTRNATDSRRQ